MKNYYFATMSIINGKSIKEGKVSTLSISDTKGKTYYGFQTNEVPSYYFIDKLAEEGLLFDRICFFVTKECQENKFCIEGVEYTTCEYVHARIRDYLDKIAEQNEKIARIIKEEYGNSVEDYLLKTISYVLLEDSASNKELYKKLDKALDMDQGLVKVYMDLTGGSRLSQIIAMLMMRVMENMGEEIVQLIYVDITKDHRIIDATQNYRVCRLIGEKDTVKFAEEVKKLGIDETDDLDTIQKISSIKADSENSIKSVSRKELQQLMLH